MLGAVDALMDADDDQTVAAFRAAVDTPKLAHAAVDRRAYERLERRGEFDAMLSHYSTLRQYLPGFLGLPFQAAAGSEALLQAIEIVTRHVTWSRTSLPSSSSFAPSLRDMIRPRATFLPPSISPLA
jgi:hypothetical protein